ncbi:hypothetical protein A2U01_0002064 [Trifolium medium]|uniref:TF-B3 domain-containing protein n=1 Tax=Trifolium medium TaxID=97028 RepID=A0A392M223_9FABA|nr:hypothetical protein [Trifolium medium]
MDRTDPSRFPTWHTKSRCLRKAVSFKLTITEDPKVVPVLTLPEDMGEYLWDTMLDRVFIIGANLEKQLCDLEYQQDPFVVRISSGWSECVGIHGFEVGDRLLFSMRNIYDCHLIWVTKLD